MHRKFRDPIPCRAAAISRQGPRRTVSFQNFIEKRGICLSAVIFMTWPTKKPDGSAVWRRILPAIEELQRGKREGEAVNLRALLAFAQPNMNLG
jgi:hypothetical protein